MKSFTKTVEIAAPPERVWAVMTDVERWPEWTASMTSVRRLDAGPLAVGSRVHVRQPKLLPTVYTVTEITERAACRSFTWQTAGPGVLAWAAHVVEPAGAGARATLSVHISGALAGVVARLIRDLTERYLALEAAGLKRRSEM